VAAASGKISGPMSLSGTVKSGSTRLLTGAIRAVLRSPATRGFATSLTGAVLLGVLPAVHPASPAPAHITTTLSAGGGWLTRFNLWRASAGQSSLTENTSWSSGDYNHAVYMVKNNLVTHYETPGVPYYTTSGATAAQNSNIYVSSSTSTTDEQAIDWWMGAPFHAMAMMDPRLTQTGFGSYRDTTTSPWQLGAALDVISGNSFAGGKFPVYFPGNLSTEPLTSFSGNEFPDPTSACPGYGGLPVFVEVGGNVSTAVGAHTITANGTVLDTCAIDSTNSTLGSYLKARGGVIVMPRQPLQNGVRYVVAVTVNGVPYTWSFTVGPFASPPPPPMAVWTSLGGVVTSGPGVSSWGASRIDAFARGSDNALYQNTWNGTAWSGWSSLGGGLTSGPAAASWSANRIDVFVRGYDNQLYHKFFYGTGWSGWEPLGGYLTSGPAVASWAAGRLDVFVRGSDNGLWQKSWNGQGWTGWASLGGIVTSDPGAVSSAANRVSVVVRGTDNAVWTRSWNGSGWTGWSSLGGVATSAPAMASCSNGHYDVFVRGSDNQIYRVGFNGASWGGWSGLGGSWTSGPSAICEPGTSTIGVFASGTDSALWTESVAGS
jgi:uncharacterized protein YkwD